MRLYLSSFYFGKHSERLCELARGIKRTLVINNALDAKPKDERSHALQLEFQGLRKLGFDPAELDLRLFFGAQKKLPSHIPTPSLVWVRGGNSFILRRAMHYSGFDKLLPRLLAEGCVYGAFSAGAVVLAPTLRGIELVDDAQEVPPGYQRKIIWDGLGMLPFSIAPHYRSEHPESAAVEKVVQFWQQENLAFKTLRDGEVLICENGQFELCP